MRRHQKHVVEGKPFGNLLSYHGFLEFTSLDNSSRNSFVSVPRAVATGPGYAVVPTACVASVLRLSSRNDCVPRRVLMGDDTFSLKTDCAIRSQPPPQAGCPLGDPGPLAALTQDSSSERKTPAVWRGHLRNSNLQLAFRRAAQVRAHCGVAQCSRSRQS